MNWMDLAAYFFGGIFAANAVPHYAAGMMGRPFQSPFAKPPGKGLSSSLVNVVWGLFNAAMAYLLVMRVGAFDFRAAGDAGAFGLGVAVMSLFAAHHFGRLHGGGAPGA